MINEMNCLQYCINGMNNKIFDFSKTPGGKNFVKVFKTYGAIREEQVKEFLLSYFSYFMVQAVVQLKGGPQTQAAVIDFMLSEEFTELHNELTQVVLTNFRQLMSCLDRQQRRKLEALFN